MTEITRHFTTAVYIVHENKVLLHVHKKLHKLLAVGGHIDRDELPDEAALREVKEETGLDVVLYDPRANENNTYNDGTKDLNIGSNCNLHNINEFHQHISFDYFAAANSIDLNPEEGESTDFKWYTADEVMQITDIADNVKTQALAALRVLSN